MHLELAWEESAMCLDPSGLDACCLEDEEVLIAGESRIVVLD